MTTKPRRSTMTSRKPAARRPSQPSKAALIAVERRNNALQIALMHFNGQSRTAAEVVEAAKAFDAFLSGAK